MSMRRSTGRELRTLRIVAFHFLTKTECMLCHTPLLTDAKETGGRVGHPIDPEYTEHHIDGNHENHSPENRAIVHRNCHKIFERMLTHYIGKGLKPVEAEALALDAVVEKLCNNKGEGNEHSVAVSRSVVKQQFHSHSNGKQKRNRVVGSLHVSRVQDLAALQASADWPSARCR